MDQLRLSIDSYRPDRPWMDQMNGAAAYWPDRRILSAHDAHALFGPRLSSARREMLGIAHLDSEHWMIGFRFHYSASASGVDLPLRTIIADAMKLGSRGLLIAHNHPSGDPRPSQADLVATRALVQVTQPIGIRLHDHLVFARAGHVSLKDAGLL